MSQTSVPTGGFHGAVPWPELPSKSPYQRRVGMWGRELKDTFSKEDECPTSTYKCTQH